MSSGTVRALMGGTFVIEPGFKATWEVIERVRKYYVFVLA
jgi:uncharacterized protein